MIFETLVVGPLGVNCFILGDEETKEGIIIDPGSDIERILNKINRIGLKVKTILNTHGHFDHIGANAKIISTLGAKLLIHKSDAAFLTRANEYASLYGLKAEDSPPPNSFLEDAMEITFGKYQLKVLHTPGHSSGGCCFYLASEKMLFTGDTLFAEGVGRTDLPGSSEQALRQSIKTKLFVLADDTAVYAGHGPSSTIGHEKSHNPFIH